MPQKAPLGTTYEITTPSPLDRPPEPSQESGKILRRLERYRLQNVSRELLPDERVGQCLRSVISSHVSVLRSEKNAHYKGLTICGSIWHCAVCAAKITERRQKELRMAIENWKEQGGTVLMLTQTVPHYVFQPLSTVLEGITKARWLWRKRKAFKTLKTRVGLAGTVRVLEVTYGENGWHVHVHELLFLRESPADLGALERELHGQWASAVESAGLGKINHHGLQLQDGSEASKYASKWGMEQEMTKSHVKMGREGSLTPWDLLRACDRGDRIAGQLFQEYAKGFKGKRQLVYTRGLRDLLGLGPEVSDEELAQKVEEDAELLGRLTRSEWRFVVQAEQRGQLLEVAMSDGWDGVIRLIGDLIKNSG